MPDFSLSWDAVAGAVGYNVHSGQVSGLYTDMTDVEDVLSATVTVPWSGVGYAAVAAYDSDHYEGLYSEEKTVNAGATAPPVGTLTLSVR